MADTPPLAREYGQRLLARDQSEAAELIDSHIISGPTDSVYDALMLPALSYAERDRLEGRLSSEEEAAIIEATRELMLDAPESLRSAEPASSLPSTDLTPLGAREPLAVLRYAVNGLADEVALTMLGQLLHELPITLEITGTRMQALQLVALVRQPLIENAVAREEVALVAPRRANCSRPLGALGVNRREPADAHRRWGEPRCLPAGREPELPQRAPGGAASPGAGSRRGPGGSHGLMAPRTCLPISFPSLPV